MTASDGFLALPPRSAKPRAQGLTHIFDKGLTIAAIEGLYEVAGDYIDVAKLGWGSSYITCNLAEKIALYRSVSYTHLRAHETVLDLVCRLLLEKKKKQ